MVMNSGVYPIGAMIATQRPQHEAEHKELMKQFKTWTGVRDGLKEDLILQAVEGIYLEEIKPPTIGFLNVTPRAMLTRLNSLWGELDCIGISFLITVEKAIKQFERVNIQSNCTACMNIVLAHFRKCSKFSNQLSESGKPGPL
jgi:hypothetical protein